MPLQNRMLPDGEIVAENWRGTFMGNRGGRIHQPETKTLLKRRSASRRWICCVLSFKNRQRAVMGEGYTEIFFLDEVSALAAGHRPCFECRRSDALAFQRAWQDAFELKTKPNADMMDKQLHLERTGEKSTIDANEFSHLPEGTMLHQEGAFYALKQGTLIQWSGNGYIAAPQPTGELNLLTPAAILSVLSSGYNPEFHPTANTIGSH